MTLALSITKANSSVPVTGWMGCIRRWESVPGYRIAERDRGGHGISVWCHTQSAAIRIAVALFEGRGDLVDQILLAEQREDFCVEDRSDEFRMLVADGRVKIVKPRARRAPKCRMINVLEAA